MLILIVIYADICNGCIRLIKTIPPRYFHIILMFHVFLMRDFRMITIVGKTWLIRDLIQLYQCRIEIRKTELQLIQIFPNDKIIICILWFIKLGLWRHKFSPIHLSVIQSQKYTDGFLLVREIQRLQRWKPLSWGLTLIKNCRNKNGNLLAFPKWMLSNSDWKLHLMEFLIKF